MKDKKAIKSAKRIMKYCNQFKHCQDGCVFQKHGSCRFIFGSGLPESWALEGLEEEEKK